MVQVIGIAVVGGVLWYGYRAFKREMERVGKETRNAEKRPGNTQSLERGEDGVFRPKQD